MVVIEVRVGGDSGDGSGCGEVIDGGHLFRATPKQPFFLLPEIDGYVGQGFISGSS